MTQRCHFCNATGPLHKLTQGEHKGRSCCLTHAAQFVKGRTSPPPEPSIEPQDLPDADLWNNPKQHSDIPIAPGIRVEEQRGVIFPHRGRHNENSRRAIQKFLCDNKVFREQVTDLAAQLCAQQEQDKPASDEPSQKDFEPWLAYLQERKAQFFHSLQYQAKRISDYWGFDGWQWIAWLALNWNTSLDAEPPIEPGVAFQVLAPWVVEPVRHKLQEGETEWETKYVQITLRPGISLVQANRALKIAVDLLPLGGTHGKPPLSDRECQIIKQLLDEQKLPVNPKRGEKQRAISQVYDQVKEIGKGFVKGSFRDITLATVARECIKQMKKRGIPTKHYETKKTDIR